MERAVFHGYFLVLSASLFLASGGASRAGEEGKVFLKEDFTTGLSEDWFWGLGTWKAGDGILRGFESGERRHGR